DRLVARRARCADERGDGLRRVGQVRAISLDRARDSPDEHAGVPVMAAGSDHLLCSVALRLLDEALHAVDGDRCLEIKPLATLDVAEARVRSLGLYAQRDDLAALCRCR